MKDDKTTRLKKQLTVLLNAVLSTPMAWLTKQSEESTFQSIRNPSPLGRLGGVLLLLLLSHTLLAQNGFNNLYDLYGKAEGSANIVVTPDSGFVFSGNYPDTNKRVMFIVKVDKTGNLIWKKEYQKPGFEYYSGAWGGLQLINDTNFILSAAQIDTTGKILAYLAKFDAKGDTLWFKTFGKYIDNTLNFNQIINGRKIISAGTARNTTNGTQFYLACTDIDGNLLWENNYGGAINEACNYVDVAPDGGFVLGGFTDSFGAGQGDFYIVKTDSLGVMLWDTTMGGVGNEGGGTKVLMDGSILVFGSFGSLNNAAIRDAYIAKLDANGKLLWEKRYGMRSDKDDNFKNAVELSNGDIMLSSFFYDATDNDLIVASLFKINAQGDSLWRRKYRTNRNERHLIQDLRATPDGGFVFCGFIWPDDFPNNTQDTWIVKVDSMGCVQSGCAIATAIEEEEKIALGGVLAYPNPTRDYLTFETHLPSKYKKGAISIYNIAGQLIEQHIVSLNYQTQTIATTHLPKGIYIYTFTGDGTVLSTKRFVKL